MLIQTVPTGLDLDPPVGPATPLIAIAISARSYFRTPFTISSVIFVSTAPNSLSVCLFTPRNLIFAIFE